MLKNELFRLQSADILLLYIIHYVNLFTLPRILFVIPKNSRFSNV
jgi:hypothetical protein